MPCVNRSELIQGVSDVEYFAIIGYRLEPEWVVVLGRFGLLRRYCPFDPRRKFDATALPELAAEPISELVNFKHIERPKVELTALRALFELLDLTPGMVRSSLKARMIQLSRCKKGK